MLVASTVQTASSANCAAAIPVKCMPLMPAPITVAAARPVKPRWAKRLRSENRRESAASEATKAMAIEMPKSSGS